MRPGKKTGMKDVAKLCNVSVVTVSNALAGKGGLSEEVRQRIKETADEIGYIYTPKKTSDRYIVADNTALTIGVFSKAEYIAVGGSFYWELYQKTAYAASKQQCMTMLEVVGVKKDFFERLDLLQGKMLDAVIVIGMLDGECIEAIEQKLGKPMVFLDFRSGGKDHSSIMSANEQGMYESTRELIKNGHKKIGFAGDVGYSSNIRQRYDGYRRCMEEYGLELNEEWILNDRRVDDKNMRYITLPEVLPEAFCCSSDLTAGILYNALRKRNLTVPGDISLAGYDDYLFSHPMAGKLTTYHVDTDEMARQALLQVKKEIKDKQTGYTEKYISGYMIKRSSIKKRTAKEG